MSLIYQAPSAKAAAAMVARGKFFDHMSSVRPRLVDGYDNIVHFDCTERTSHVLAKHAPEGRTGWRLRASGPGDQLDQWLAWERDKAALVLVR